MPDLTCLIGQKTLQLLTSSQDATAVYLLALADFQPWPLEIFEYHRHHPVQVKRTLAEWHQVLQKVSLAASSHAVSCCLQHLFRLRIFDFLFHHLLLLKKTHPTKARWKFWEVPSWDIGYIIFQNIKDETWNKDMDIIAVAPYLWSMILARIACLRSVYTDCLEYENKSAQPKRFV